jgi:hypothetical protein
MLEGQTISLGRYSISVVIACLAVAALVYFRFGFPYKHRNLPPVEPVLLAVLGTFLAASGLKVVYSLLTSRPITEDLIVPLIVSALILCHMGTKDVIKAFRGVESKPKTPAEKPDSKE